MSNRDPRWEPRPGDVVIFGPQWQSEQYEVLSAFGGVVRYRMNGYPLSCALSKWREWSAGW